MKKLLLNVVGIVVVVIIVFYANKGVNTYLGKEALSGLTFNINNLDAAKELALKENKLVLADYSAIWCPTCRKLDTQIFANGEVASLINSRFVYTRLDYDTEAGEAFAKKYELVGFPRVLVLSPTGNKLAEMPLSFEPAQYMINLEKVITTFSEN